MIMNLYHSAQCVHVAVTCSTRRVAYDMLLPLQQETPAVQLMLYPLYCCQILMVINLYHSAKCVHVAVMCSTCRVAYAMLHAGVG